MGWESNNVFQVLIITGSTGSGVFVYSPVPGAGNLVASITAAGGTDLYGNSVLAGIVSYQKAPAAALQIFNQTLTFNTAPSEAGPWTALGQFGDTLWTEPAASSISLMVGTSTQLLVTSTLSSFFEPVLVTLGTGAGKLLQITNTSVTTSNPSLLVQTAANTPDFAFGIQVAGDTNQRFRVDSDGSVHWGSGAAATDVILSRTAANTLTVGSGDTFVATVIEAIAAATGNAALIVETTGDTNPRFQVLGSGKAQWGPGNAAVDTDLFRGGLGVLQTDSTFAITNQAAPATLAGAAQLYAAAGQPAYKNPAGLTVNLSGANLATVNINTVTQAVFTNLTNATIPAADAEVGATYKLTAFGNGTWGSTQQQLTLGARFGAAATNTVGSTPAITNTALAASAAFQWTATVTAVCVTTGVTGTWSVSITGCVTETANPLLPGTAANNTIPFASGTGSTDITLDTTIAEILGISAQWASTTGAPTISKHISYFERIA